MRSSVMGGLFAWVLILHCAGGYFSLLLVSVYWFLLSLDLYGH